MADINATDLTPETKATLDGSEQFVMFDSTEGKRGTVEDVGDYILQSGDADGQGNTIGQIVNDIQGDIEDADENIGDLTSLTTEDKTDLVSAINEVKEEADTTDGKADTNAGAISDLQDAVALKADESELADYAKIDGAYESMTVGNAEQLVSSISKEDNAPYNFRTSGGSLDIGDREYLDKIVGGTVAVNEWIDNQQFTSMTHWAVGPNATSSITGNVLTAVKSGSSPAGNQFVNYTGPSKIPKNHVVMIVANLASNSSSVTVQAIQASPWTGLGQQIVNVTATLTQKIVILKPTAGDISNLIFNFDNKEDISIQNPCVIDLTQMFGATIADYIYTLETGSAGAGATWFKKLFPKPYYAYNAGELVSVKTSSHDTVGFNQWDEEWETYYGRVRSKNFIRVLPSTTYFISQPTGTVGGELFFFDADQNAISNTVYAVDSTFVTPSNATYMKFMAYSNYGTTYNHDICINLSWDGERDGEYEAYKKNTYPLDSDLELRGIPKLDSANNLYYDGDEYEDDGTVTRKYGIVDLGTINWVYDGDEIFRVSDTRMKFMGNGICAKYKWVQVTSWSQVGDGEMSVTNSEQSPILRVHDSTAGTDAAAFKTAMSGVYLVYELATPTTEEAEPYQNPQIVDDFGTEEFVDTRDVAVPVGHSTRYQPNLRAKLEMMPNSPDGDGDYIVRQTSDENEYVALASNATIQALMAKLPNAPSEDGAYKLTCTVTNGTAVYSWEAE